MSQGKSYNLEKNSRKTAEKLFDEKKNTMKYIDLFYDAIKTKKYSGPFLQKLKHWSQLFVGLMIISNIGITTSSIWKNVLNRPTIPNTAKLKETLYCRGMQKTKSYVLKTM